MDKPDSLEALLSGITPEIHERLKEAVALGRWENGERLTDEQKSLCLQAVIAYDQAHLNPEARVGYVKPKPAPCAPKDAGGQLEGQLYSQPKSQTESQTERKED